MKFIEARSAGEQMKQLIEARPKQCGRTTPARRAQGNNSCNMEMSLCSLAENEKPKVNRHRVNRSSRHNLVDQNPCQWVCGEEKRDGPTADSKHRPMVKKVSKEEDNHMEQILASESDIKEFSDNGSASASHDSTEPEFDIRSVSEGLSEDGTSSSGSYSIEGQAAQSETKIPVVETEILDEGKKNETEEAIGEGNHIRATTDNEGTEEFIKETPCEQAKEDTNNAPTVNKPAPNSRRYRRLRGSLAWEYAMRNTDGTAGNLIWSPREDPI